MRQMIYTMSALCHDGVRRQFQHMAFFLNTDILRHHLARWTGSGETYQYFETAEQRALNEVSHILPGDFLYPLFAMCWHGKQSHEFTFDPDWRRFQ